MRAILLLFILLFSNNALANKLHFVAEDLPTFHFRDAQGQPAGALVELVNELAKTAKVDYEIELVPFARAYRLLEHDPNVLMFSLLKSPNRERSFRWLGETYHNSAFLVGLKERNLSITSLSQAKSLTVGTIRGYYSETFLRNAGFKENENLTLSVKYDQLWHMLFQGHIDLVLTNNIALKRELKQSGLSIDKVTQYLELGDFPSKLYLVGNLTIDAEKALALSSALEQVKRDGRYQAILKRWGLKP